MMSGIFMIHTEKIDGAGEDAEPYFKEFPGSGAIAAVFDGMGGAGSAQWEMDDERASGAKFASGFARSALENFVDQISDNYECEDQQGRLIGHFSDIWNAFTGAHLGRVFDSELAQKAALLSSTTPSRIKSKMLRVLPTTLACVIYGRKEGKIEVRTLWAGDSRVYYLSVCRGLRLLTADHNRKSKDASPNVGAGDAPLSNFLSEIVPNHVDERSFSISDPGIIICATDGVFSYFESDAHFELALWLAIQENMNSGSESASQTLRKEVLRVAGDDTSAVVIPIDFVWDDDSKKRVSVLTENIQEIEKIDEALASAYVCARPLLLAARADIIKNFTAQEEKIDGGELK